MAILKGPKSPCGTYSTDHCSRRRCRIHQRRGHCRSHPSSCYQSSVSGCLVTCLSLIGHRRCQDLGTRRSQLLLKACFEASWFEVAAFLLRRNRLLKSQLLTLQSFIPRLLHALVMHTAILTYLACSHPPHHSCHRASPSSQLL